MKKVITGLEKLGAQKSLQSQVNGNIGYLCHTASVTSNFTHGIEVMKKTFGKRLVKLFGPQHGLITDVQDNMVETSDFIHPYFQLPVYSLYGETRIPTDEMLTGIDTMVVDLQDVGTRVYTYISTMTLLMEKCANKGIEVIILDRPNPAGGEIIEGNILDPNFVSFVGRHPIPMRHSLTMGEMAKLANQYFQRPCKLKVITMDNWDRSSFFDQTGLPWVLPSPNLPTSDGSIVFAGSVIFEGTNISEGRGTTRSLEMIGHPDLGPFSFVESLTSSLENLQGFALRPTYFMPTFQKHQGVTCGGIQIHITDASKFKPWTVCQLICQKLYHTLGNQFSWNNSPYEYEFDKLAIDLINGTDKIRKWIETNGPLQELQEIETNDLDSFVNKRENVLLY